MISAKSIAEANSNIRTTDIKGKDYAEVNQRIKAFRSICPNGSIETELVGNENGVCIIKAVIKDETGKILGTGYAYEKEGSSFINKTSYIENCETSSVGRALGMCGIGIDTSIASAEEVLNATIQQDYMKAATEKLAKPHILTLKDELKRTGISESSFVAFYNVRKIENMNVEQFREAMDKLKQKPDADKNKKEAKESE